MNEIWKDIPGFPNHHVSNLGRVKSFHFKKPLILTPRMRNGCLTVRLSQNLKVKFFSVARLVASAFLPNPENKSTVKHLNGDKFDCQVENLEWVKRRDTFFYRGEDSPRAKLTNEQARYIRNNPDNLSIKQLAEKFGVSQVQICQVQRGERYKTAGGKIRKKKTKHLSAEVREQICREYKFGVRGCGSHALAKKYRVSSYTILRIVRENQSSSNPTNVTDTDDGIATLCSSTLVNSGE